MTLWQVHFGGRWIYVSARIAALLAEGGAYPVRLGD
jgi:hypothetical protein